MRSRRGARPRLTIALALGLISATMATVPAASPVAAATDTTGPIVDRARIAPLTVTVPKARTVKVRMRATEVEVEATGVARAWAVVMRHSEPAPLATFPLRRVAGDRFDGEYRGEVRISSKFGSGPLQVGFRAIDQAGNTNVDTAVPDFGGDPTFNDAYTVGLYVRRPVDITQVKLSKRTIRKGQSVRLTAVIRTYGKKGQRIRFANARIFVGLDPVKGRYDHLADVRVDTRGRLDLTFKPRSSGTIVIRHDRGTFREDASTERRITVRR